MATRPPKRISKRVVQIKLTAKWIVYFLLATLSLVCMTTGGANSAKPLFLIPLAVCLCSYYGEFTSACIGLLCGLMLDMGASKLLGASSLFMIVLCVGTSLLFTHLMRNNLVNILIITIPSAFLHALFDYFFYFSLWNYEGAELVLTKRLLPSALMTCVSIPFIYFIVKFITRKLGKPEKATLEEQDKNIERV